MKGSYSAIAWRILKILGVTTAMILSLAIIGAWIIFRQRNELLLDRIQSYLEESQSGELEIKGADLRFFRQFPDLTIEFDGVNYYEHRDSLRIPGELPILHADRLFLAVDTWSLLNSEVNVSQLSVEQAQFNVVQYPDGQLNLDYALTKPVKPKPLAKVPPKTEVKIAPSSPKGVSPKTKGASPAKSITSISVDLKLIQLRDVRLSWKSDKESMSSVAFIKNLDAGLSSSQSLLEGSLTTNSRVEAFDIGQSALPSADLAFQGTFRYDKVARQFTILESSLTYDIFSATLEGSYSHQQDLLSVQFDASANDLQLLSLLVKPEILRNNPELLKHGDIFVKGRIFGELKKNRPSLDITFGVKDLGLNLPNNLGKFEKVGFEGMYRSGSARDYSEAQLEINNLRGRLPGGHISGRFHIHDFVKPYVRYKLNGDLKLDGYDQVFRMGFLKDLKGSLSLRADFEGLVDLTDKHKMDSSRSSLVSLNNLSFVLARSNKRVSGLSGIIETRNNLTALKQISFNYDKSDVLLNMEVTNLMYRTIGKETISSINGNWQSNQISTHDFILDTLRTPSIQDRITDLSFDFSASPSRVLNSKEATWITFEIRNLSARFDKLPDINQFSAKGLFRKDTSGLKLDLHECQLIMPQGKLDITGDLLVPESREWSFNARAKMDKFPWMYVRELVAEIRPDVEPGAKQVPVSSMELITANLDLSATIKSNPSHLDHLVIRNSSVMILLPDSRPLAIERLNLTRELLPTNRQAWNFNARVKMDKFPWSHVKELVSEIRSGIDPAARYVPASQPELITADLDLSAAMMSSPFSVEQLDVKNGHLNVLLPDLKTFSVDKLNLTLDELYLNPRERSEDKIRLKSMSCQANLGQLKVPDLAPFDITLSMTGKEDHFDIGFSANRLKAARESGHFLMDISQEDPAYQFRYDVEDASLVAFLQEYHKGKLMEGKIDYAAKMHSTGKTWADIKQNLEGDITISGDSLTLHGMDIDNFLKKFKKTQKFNLTDLGAVLIAGPLGIVVTKASDFVVLSIGNLDPSQYTSITTLLAKWKFGHRQLMTEDVAFTTPLSRIAFDGRIDFAKDSIPGFTVAVVDKYGCSLMDQNIYGKTNALKMGKLHVTKTLFGSVTNFVNAVAGKDCKPIYLGTVKHPGQP